MKSTASMIEEEASGRDEVPQRYLAVSSVPDSEFQVSSRSKSSFYVESLMPPVKMDYSDIGKRLKRVSAIPGRQRSLDGRVKFLKRESIDVSFFYLKKNKIKRIFFFNKMIIFLMRKKQKQE